MRTKLIELDLYKRRVEEIESDLEMLAHLVVENGEQPAINRIVRSYNDELAELYLLTEWEVDILFEDEHEER